MRTYQEALRRIEELEREVAELRAENARLRNRNFGGRKNHDDIWMEISRERIVYGIL